MEAKNVRDDLRMNRTVLGQYRPVGDEVGTLRHRTREERVICDFHLIQREQVVVRAQRNLRNEMEISSPLPFESDISKMDARRHNP